MEKNNIFFISEDSFYYLKQMLKLQIIDGDISIKPFIALIYMLEKLEYLSEEEFTYLLPLCKNNDDVKKMCEYIKANRLGLNIDEVIELKILEMDNYLEAWNLFSNTINVCEKTFEDIGINRKSRSYDRPYNEFYHILYNLVFNMSKESFNNRIPLYKELYSSIQKISGNAKNLWLEYLFMNYKINKIDEEFDERFKKIEISLINDVASFKFEFFKKLHLFKWKVNLKEYYDLNRRYFHLTDIIKFENGYIELALLPKYYFKDIIDTLLEDDLTNPKEYLNYFHNNLSLEKISKHLNLSIDKILININKDLGTNLDIKNVNDYLNNERLKEFNKLIDERFTKENLILLLENIQNRNDEYVKKLVTDNATIPTIFEYLVGIIWYKISDRKGNILDFMNLSLDSDLLPKTHAGEGMADILYKYDKCTYPKHDLLIEATISESTGQRVMEMEPVSRHLGENIKLTGNELDYAIFVASNLDERIILDFRNMKTRYYPKGNGEFIKGLKIIPIDISILIKIMKSGINYNDIYEWFQKAFLSDVSDPLWYKIEILENI